MLNNALSPWLAAHLGSVASALWVGVAVCGASLVCALALGALDSHHSRAIRRRFKVEAAGAGESPVACADVARFGRPFWLLAGCCVVVYGCVLPFNNVASALLQATLTLTPTLTLALTLTPSLSLSLVLGAQLGAAP